MSSLAIHGQPVLLFAEECEHPANHEENPVSVLHVRLALGELLVVVDGGAGSREGALASRMAVEHFYAHLSGLPLGFPVDNAIRDAAARANAGILAAASAPDFSLQGMRASVVAALLQQDGDITRAWIGHMGDCRAYLLRAGRMHRLTVDHTVVQELLDREMITASEAWNHPQAMVVTRSLGQRLAVEIELEEIPLAVGDTLLLCSGGLWRPVPEKEIQAAAESETAEAAAHNLLALALSADGKKSVGLEIARMIPPPDARHEERPPIALGALLTIFLLSLGCLCALVWFVFKSN